MQGWPLYGQEGAAATASGIGYEAARLLAEQGLRTVLTARNEQLGREAVEKLSQGLAASGSEGSVEFHQLDISNHESVQAFADWAKEHLGQVDILINNAGAWGLG